DDRYVVHFGTFNGHPVAAAVGIATLREVGDGAAQAAAARHAGQLRAGLQTILDELRIDGFIYGESSTFHVYMRGAKSASRRRAGPETTSAHELLAIPVDVIDALHCELRLRGIDLMSYNGGVASSVHGQAELDF